MIKFIDDFLNNITMYRLILYYLIILLIIATIFSFLGVLPFNPFSLIFSTLFITIVCWSTNTLFASVFKAQPNVESVYVTAMILSLIITPITTPNDLWFLGWASIWAMASKYIFAINKKHIFNPAAFAVALTAITINQSASWWVGTLPMTAFVTIGGLLVVRKIRRWDMIFTFFVFALGTVILFGLSKGENVFSLLQKLIEDSSLLFFAFVMLTEPLTTPPTKQLQNYYGALVGILFAPQIHIGSFYSTPELALIAGNIFSYIVSPKEKLILELKEKIKIAPDIYDFIFSVNQKFSYKPGQYMEWTFRHNKPDGRGNRRYFTLASSPTENEIRVGIKFYENSSSFKKSMLATNPGSKIIASQLAGDFYLPNDLNKKFLFIAGGIGITPFRSIIKYLLDTNQKRDAVLFYANKKASDIIYQDVFDKANEQLQIRTIYTLTDKAQIPPDWNGKAGYVDEQMIMQEVPDYKERVFYLSGRHSMVSSFEKTLSKIGVSKSQIITDFFPGFA